MSLIKKLFKYYRKRNTNMVRFQLLMEIGRKLVPDYRFSWPYLDWWNDKSFNNYLERFDEFSKLNDDRRFMLYQLLRLVDDVPGDTAECGSLKGAGSYLMLMMNNNSGKHERWHHVFDSFEGLSKPESADGGHWSEGDLSVPMRTVGENLSGFDRFTLHKGWIPTQFPAVADKRFAFVHIDVDLYQPTLDSIEFFYSRVNEGGIVLCDDYGSGLCPGATQAVDEYLSDKPEKMIYMSCGSGFMIKGCRTAGQLRQ